jgi:hypothetical protein
MRMPTVLLVAEDKAVRSTSHLAGWRTIPRGVCTNFGYYDIGKSMTQTSGGIMWLSLLWLKEPEWQH